MEGFPKNRFSKLIKVEENLTNSVFKGFDNLFKTNVILKLLFPIATKEIGSLNLLSHLIHHNLISPIDLIPLSGDYYCIVFPEYQRTFLSKQDLKEENVCSLTAQILGALKFITAKSIAINNFHWRNFVKENGKIYLAEFEESMEKKTESIDKLISKFPGSMKTFFKEKENLIDEIKKKEPFLLTSFLGFDMRRKENQIIDGFADEKGLSATRVLGIFGREGHGKSSFLRNFMIRNRSLSSPIIFLNSGEKNDFLISLKNQMLWLLNENEVKKERELNIEKIPNYLERLFSEHGYSSILILFDDLDKADYFVLEAMSHIGNFIKEDLAIKFIYTSQSYFPFLKELRSLHINLSFRNYSEFRENLWVDCEELEDFVEIAWKRCHGNLHFFHWLIKNRNFFNEHERDVGKYTETISFENYSKKEIHFFEILSCFPKGFDVSWVNKIRVLENKGLEDLLKMGILERKGSRYFLKEPWLSIIIIPEDKKKKIHEIATEFDIENSHYHYFMCYKYEEGARRFLEFLSGLLNNGQIKEAIENAKTYMHFIEKVENSEMKYIFYYLVSEIYLKIGAFDEAFDYLIKSSHFVKPSSEKWMRIKAKIAECLYGLMKYEKAIKTLKESIEFAELYNFQEILKIFNYLLSKNLWKTGNTEESEDILKKLEKDGSPYFSAMAKRDRGYYAFLRGKIQEGKELIEGSVKLLENFPIERAIALKYLACIYAKEKKWEEAFALFTKAMRIFEKDHDLFNMACLCSDIGKLFLEKEDLLNADIWFKKANSIFSKIDNPRGIVLSQFNLTEVMIPFGEWKKAKEILIKCAEIDRGSQNTLSYAYDISSLGYVEYLLGNFEESKDLLEKARKILLKYDAKKELMDTNLKLAEILLEEQDWESFKKVSEEMESLLESEEADKEALYYKLIKANQFLKKKEFEKTTNLIKDVVEKAGRNELKSIVGKALLLKAQITKRGNESEAENLFLKSSEIFKELHNNFMDNICVLEFYKTFPKKIDPPRAKEAIEWLRNAGYFKVSQYEKAIFQEIKEEPLKKLLKLLWETCELEWINVLSISSEKISIEEAFPSINDRFSEDLDISVLAPKISRKENMEILQVPLLKSGILNGFILCGKKSNFSSSHVELILSFIEPIYSMLFSERQKEEERVEGEIKIVGNFMKKIMQIINKIKDYNYPVLILGESGTGKELIARYIHDLSLRKGNPFVPINCSALPEHLLESELFGWVKGAFTGANYDRKGLIEEADGGTFFLDEIGDLPLSLQAKLLRVLQEKETRRLGENKIRKVDVRFISATNKSLEEEIKEKRFREDLYYRIKGVVINIPPLRERKEDIPILANYFLEKYSEEMKREKVYLSYEAMEALLYYSWPGNARELEIEIRNSLMMLDPGKKIIDLDDLSPHISSKRFIKLDLKGAHDLSTAKELFERSYIKEVLRKNNWNRKKSAEDLKITRQGLFKLMKKYGIKEDV